MIAASDRGTHISTLRRARAVSGAGGKLEKPIRYDRAPAGGCVVCESDAHASDTTTHAPASARMPVLIMRDDGVASVSPQVAACGAGLSASRVSQLPFAKDCVQRAHEVCDLPPRVWEQTHMGDESGGAMSSTNPPTMRPEKGRSIARSNARDGSIPRSGSAARVKNGNGRGAAGTSNGPSNGRRLANGLGWLSIGLGLAELVAPDSVARLIGVKPTGTTRALLRFAGVRELGVGVGILSRRQQKRWVASRVGGDMMDLALLGVAFRADRTESGRAAAATVAVVGVTALDVLCARQLPNGGASDEEQAAQEPKGIRVKRSVTVNRPLEDVYAFWHDFQNLPRFMEHLESVEITGERRSHWKAKAPAGTTVEWDAEVTGDWENELIAWRSVGTAPVHNEGIVHFSTAPGGRGTEVHVDLRYDPPGGSFTAAIAKLFGEEPGVQIADDLGRFKQVMETGEVGLSDATEI